MRKNSTLPLPVPTEAEEQIALFEWAALQSGRFPELALLYHVPNGGSRNKIEAARLRAQGVKSGVPDLCLPVARGGNHGLLRRVDRPFSLQFNAVQGKNPCRRVETGISKFAIGH